MKKILALVLAVAMLLTMAVIPATAESTKTTVVFWNSWTGGDGDTLQALVEKYNASQDEVYIDMTRTTSFSDMLQTSMPTGECADLILLSTDSMLTYMDYLRPMNDIFENTSLKAEDFSDAYLSMAYNGDNLMGIPFQIVTYMMYYNKDLFTAAGLDPETPPTTFEGWTEAANAISALSTEESPVYGSGLFYCYNGQNQAVIQRFGTDYIITADGDSYKQNILDNQAFADAMIWMKNLYDNGTNPKEKDIDSMMAAGQIGVMCNGGWLKGTLDASGINYGIAKLPTVTGEDLTEWALGNLNCFMLTTSATDETALAAEKFIEWWMTGTGLEACDTTSNVDYSNVTPNAEWSLSMAYLNAYLPTVNSAEYQANELLVSLTPTATAQVQMFTPPANQCFSDVTSLQADYVQDWVFNGPENPTYDDVQEFFAGYADDLTDIIAEHY